ncbi:uncharacterized protein LOC111353550 [Spodoptera litura]|uniref:Uncharacterized protein LOC111353550 n=1 Tax=Spodoptera litura TaxID=69820 RepID=A0A9J7E120_SPOLT|nr:uncharacterized protein LOC111353550 [Spodoptera litura]
MPTAKCGGCAKFLSPLDAAKCNHCNGLYHRACVCLPSTGYIKPAWRCPECSKNQVRDNKADTPVRTRTAQVEEHLNPEELMETSTMSCTTLDATNPLSPDLADELRLFKEELRKEFRLMHRELQQLRTEMAQLKESVRTSDERMESLEARVGSLEQRLEQQVLPEKGSLENTIDELRCQLNDRDQELLVNDIEISGIPESRDESTLHLIKILGTKLGVNIDEKDVVHVERVGSTHRNRITNTISADPSAQRPRCISVRFARRSTRDSLLRAARVRRGLSTHDLDVNGQAHRIYINERLTRTNRQLFYLARQAGTRRNWRYVWTRDGRILARKEDGLKAERVRCEADISRIFG